MTFLLHISVLTSCLWFIRPSGNFGEREIPPAPDYSLPTSWAALPDKRDGADQVPSETEWKDGQADADIDVFFIHPTTFFGREWNAPIDDPSLNERTDDGTLRKQASVFNCCGRIYAPRYRQATLYSFLDPENGKAALNLAYQDILNSFEHYIRNENGGRPFIIASHSQGTFHATRLLLEKVDGKPILKKLIAAYLIGGAVPSRLYRKIPVCDNPKKNGCVIGWRTFEEEAAVPKLPHDPDPPYVCVNPISWKTDETASKAEEHPGGIDVRFTKIYPSICETRCSKGILRISKPNSGDFSKAIQGNYHVFDYALFYRSIRDNVGERVRNYFLSTENKSGKKRNRFD
ncbi:DUF3089 domain-containing protein [Leptospira gomenensis]|uniref:DUF3089 domain-containing protein n=1 Tax=Leptospira gomenensis TaxID=2484974 RepID=A0A5F1Y7H6_9LEPT|nr:DUF3089 domain-containing protein [Leptospira gomenensis]TGK35433.1 DUF3089 domain-containing protein [Leptospira gomenensis]TGK40759.1 DUF3089 domain-containing protein [Leptospira gomenensis]TGK68482.1 DUF3089 domain-containing protein [Leptospira gomenensis]